VNFYDPSGVNKIAVSDDGQMLMVLTGAGQVYIVSGSMPPALAYAGSATLGMAFLPNQSMALVADGVNGTVSLIKTSGGVPQVQAVTNSLGSAGGEMLIAASRDGTVAVVVETGSASASRVDLTVGSIQAGSLPATATRLDRLRDGESFVFSAEPGRAAWILTGLASGLQAVFAANGVQSSAGGRLE
jgi:DNA-binding beta-propeller fold protein YncE